MTYCFLSFWFSRTIKIQGLCAFLVHFLFCLKLNINCYGQTDTVKWLPYLYIWFLLYKCLLSCGCTLEFYWLCCLPSKDPFSVTDLVIRHLKQMSPVGKKAIKAQEQVGWDRTGQRRWRSAGLLDFMILPRRVIFLLVSNQIKSEYSISYSTPAKIYRIKKEKSTENYKLL